MKKIIKHFELIFISLLTFLISTSASAKVIFTESREYYDIEGKTAFELHNQMKEKVEKVEQNRFHVALARTYVNMDWMMQPSSGCKLTDFNLKLRVVIQMPRWKNMPTSGDLKQRWKKLYRSILKHEYTHRNYSVEYANKFDAEVSKLGVFKNCDQLEKEIRKIHEKHWGELEVKNNKFDEEDYKKADKMVSEFLGIRSASR